MRKAFSVSVVACLSASLVLSACADKNPTEPVTDEEAEAMVSSLLSQLGSGAAAGAASVASGGATASPSDSAQNAKACVFDAATMFFNCPPQNLPNGITALASFQLLDADGEPQAKFDAQTVGMRRVADITGTLVNPINTANGPVSATQTIVKHEEMVITGFRTNEPVQNGTSTMTNTIVPEGLPTGTVNVETTVTNLRIDPTMEGPKYPIAGTVTAEITSQQGTGPAFTTTQVTTYNGTAIATTVSTAQNGQTRTCTYNMVTKEPPVCS